MSTVTSKTKIEVAQNANRERGNKTKDTILSLITHSEPDGLTTDQLVKTTGLKRKRIHAICKEYMDKGELRKTGKFGTYHLGPEYKANLGIAGFLFHSKAMKGFFEFECLPTNPDICDKGYRSWLTATLIDDKKIKAFLHDPALDQFELFEFVIRVGILITFTMIRGMEYVANPNIEKDLSPSAREQLFWKWIQKAITLQSLLNAFTEVGPIYRRLRCNKTTQKEQYNGSSFDMDQRDVNTLKEAFQNIFPDAYKKLENIISDIPQQIESRRERLERFKKTRQDPDHLECDGELFPEVIADTIEDGKKVSVIKLVTCSKCGRSLPRNELVREDH